MPLLTKLLGATSKSQHTMPRTILVFHTHLNEVETLPSGPFSHHDSREQLFRSHAWYSVTMLASLELPDGDADEDAHRERHVHWLVLGRGGLDEAARVD